MHAPTNLPDWALDAISDLPGLLSRKEAGRFLRMCESSVDRLLRSGRLKSIRTADSGAGRVLIPRRSLADLLVSLSSASSSAA